MSPQSPIAPPLMEGALFLSIVELLPFELITQRATVTDCKLVSNIFQWFFTLIQMLSVVAFYTDLAYASWASVKQHLNSNSVSSL